MDSESKADIQPIAVSPKSEASVVEEAPKVVESDVPSIHWSQIESADYRQYIANLRAIGCPEQVIRDIITADVQQIFVKRSREIWPRQPREYWQKYTNETPDPKQRELLTALEAEQATVLKDLLGSRIGRQELVDLMALQVRGSELQLLTLSPEKREAAMKLLSDADFDSKMDALRAKGNYSTKDEQRVFDEKLKLLTAVLTPEELDDFHVRNSPTGGMLKSQMRYLNLTSDEYRKLLIATESTEGRQGAKEVVRGLFGDEKANEFERVSSPFYINARSGADAEGIPLDRVDQAAKLANDSMKSALAILNDRTVPVEERKSRMQQLQSRVEVGVADLLGDKASQTLLRAFRNYIRSGTSTMQP